MSNTQVPEAISATFRNLTNKLAVEQATCQLRLANYFTPYGFTPERADFDRVGAFLKNNVPTNRYLPNLKDAAEKAQAQADRFEAIAKELGLIKTQFGLTPDVNAYQSAHEQMFGIIGRTTTGQEAA